MAEITAKLVNELRARTGQGMMECKKMLSTAGGDIDKAIDEFRKKGVKASLLERSATEGRIVGLVSPDAKSGALVEVNCNTDFTAKSEPVLALANDAAKLLLADGSIDVAKAPAVAAQVTEAAQKTGENVRVGKTAQISNPAGKVAMYMYTVTNKIGVLVSATGNASDELLRDICVHIVAAKPLALALNREGIPTAMIEKEREIAIEQAKLSGKPQQIAEKIAEGKLNSFFAERVLLDQEFFNAQVFKGSIANFLKQHGVGLEKYIRLEVGQQ